MKPSPYLHPILSCNESQDFEKAHFKEDEDLEWKAMNRAGAAIARQAQLDLQELLGKMNPGRILVLVGKGHNGGDALIATRHLLNHYPAAEAYLLFPLGLSHLRPLVKKSLDDLQGAHGCRLQYKSLRQGDVKLQVHDWIGSERVELCLDGLLGMQFRPPLRSPLKELIQVINLPAQIACRIAVDVPSGVGDESDDQPFRADFTYATGIAKSGLFAPENRDFVGRIRYLDLGFFEESSAPSSRWILTDGILNFRRVFRSSKTHKKNFGHLFILGGSESMPGAVLMTVAAALRSGVGLVTAFVPEGIAAEAAAQYPAAMWVGLPQIPGQGGLALEGLGQIREFSGRATGWAIGPGMGRAPETGALIEEVLKLSDAPLLLDADALMPNRISKNCGKRPVVITPHVGEFNRLLQRPSSQAVEVEELGQMVRSTGCMILLKGSPTLIVKRGSVAYSCFGGPVLARGGSGDVLSGLIGGRLADPTKDIYDAVLEGTAWHGWAADRLAREKGQVSATATDVLDFL